MELLFLPVRQIGGPRKSSLTLEGTVLIYREKRWTHETTVQVPVELVAISERARLEGSRLVAALLSLLIPLALIAIVLGVFGVHESRIFQIASIIAASLGTIMFLVFLAYFFIRKRTVLLTIIHKETSGEFVGEGTIEFWRDSKLSRRIDEFVEQIRERQAVVDERIPYPAKHSIGVSHLHAIRELIIFIFLFCVPAMVTEIPELLFLALIPLGRYVYRKLQLNRQPKEYRRALASAARQKYEEAESYLKRLHDRYPEYVPGLILMTDIYLLTDRFDEALETSSRIPDEYLDIVEDMQQSIWQFKRIYQRRKETI